MLGLLVAVACNNAGEFVAPTTVATCTDLVGDRIAFHGDRDFTVAERNAVVAATDTLFLETQGRIDYLVQWDLDSGYTGVAAQIRRAQSFYPEVLDYEEGEAEKLDVPSITVGGWSATGPVVTLVVDDVGDDPAQVGGVALHELVHVAGMAWPGCRGTSTVCKHSPDPGALMAARWSNAPWGDSDRLLCRASCFCR